MCQYYFVRGEKTHTNTVSQTALLLTSSLLAAGHLIMVDYLSYFCSISDTTPARQQLSLPGSDCLCTCVLGSAISVSPVQPVLVRSNCCILWTVPQATLFQNCPKLSYGFNLACCQFHICHTFLDSTHGACCSAVLGTRLLVQ